MPRIQFSDVIPPEKRSIRNIPIPNSPRRATKRAAEAPKQEAPIVNEYSVPINTYANDLNDLKKPEPKNYYYEDRLPVEKNRKKFVYGGVVIVLVLAFIGIMMTVFASANVVITPKTEPLTIAMNIKVSPEITGGESSVPYEIIKITKEKNVPVEATGEEMVERKASGKIVVYNNFSSEPQRLITRTRFETKDGLVYRIPESITVPGKTTKGPGQIEVQVFADEAGAKYNIGKTDFTVPGFKNDAPRFAGFYAKSGTEMSGGLVGKVKKVEVSVRDSALLKLETDLMEETKKELGAEIPVGLVSLTDSIFYEFRELPQTDSGDTATIGKEVTAYIILLKSDTLSDKIIQSYIASSSAWQDIPVGINDFSSLKITNKPDNLLAGSTFELKVEGSAVAVAKISESAVGESLLGLRRSAMGEVMSQFKGVESIRATIRPMWKRSFPSEVEKIHVDIE